MKASYAVWVAVALAASVVQTSATQSPQQKDQGRPPVAANGLLGSVPGGLPIDNEKIVNLLIRPIQIPRIALPTKVRVSSGVMHTLLIKSVSPHYPPEALRQHVVRTVVLRINIDKNGNVSNVEAVSGNSQLIQAAIEAVQLWKYKPYLLNQIPVEVETAVQINFVISGTNAQVLTGSLQFSTSDQVVVISRLHSESPRRGSVSEIAWLRQLWRASIPCPVFCFIWMKFPWVLG